LPTPTPAEPAFEPPDRPLRSARLIVSADALWAGHPASRTVTRLALPIGQRVWQTDIGCEAATLARVTPRLFVACFDSGELVVLDERGVDIVGRRWVGHAPFGVLAAGGLLYLTLTHEDTLLALDLARLEVITREPTGRQPRGLALKGSNLYVVHLLDASVRVFDAATLGALGNIQIGLQAALAESITLHPDNPRAYVPHQRQNVTNMARLFDSTVFPVVSALDTDQLRPVRREALALDSVDTPVGMPMAVALDPSGTRLYVLNAASDDISLIDLIQGRGARHVAVGHHPRDLSLSPDGTRLYTLNLVSDDVSVVDTATLTIVDTLPLAEDLRPPIIQQGERLFLTSRPDQLARDNWIACASCHFDAGFDGQTWLGATGGPRNTPSLRGIMDTEPLHWSADRPNVQSFEETFTGLMAGTGPSEAELDALAAYLKGLKPLPSTERRGDAELTPLAIRGADVFQRAGCAACHALPLFTDRKLHDVGTGEPFHAHPSGSGMVPEAMGTAFDTPSLRELWLTAPYLHDGRAPALRDVLTTFNPTDRHGQTSGLSEGELAALEAFLLGLPLTEKERVKLFGE
jgi:YVTN family beta-propeller protein